MLPEIEFEQNYTGTGWYVRVNKKIVTIIFDTELQSFLEKRIHDVNKKQEVILAFNPPTEVSIQEVLGKH